MKNEGAETVVHAAAALSNPRIVSDSSMTAGQKVTWDCVWFGSYPQTEIVDQEETCGTYKKDWEKTTDYVADDLLYNELRNPAGWVGNVDRILDGKKYRRITEFDATTSCSNLSYYNWNDSNSYHYFRYDKIKWRVLNVSGNRALLLADQALDCQQYNTDDSPVTWADSTIRSWLNGYNDSTNNCGTDFTGKNYINSAFSPIEQEAIISTNLDNTKTGAYSNNNGGASTTDKIFLLASYDLFYTNESTSYGFYKEDYSIFDEARRCNSSTYAKAMGSYAGCNSTYLGNCWWWLRTLNSAFVAAVVDDEGPIEAGAADNDKNNSSSGGDYVTCMEASVRPSVWIDLGLANLK